MPNILRQFYRPIPTVPDPPEQDRVITSEVIHSITATTPLSWVGQPAPDNPLPDAITVSLSHAF